MIDPHVHFRDFEQTYKETIKHGLELAEKQGIEKVFDMPNTSPPILSEENIKKRLELVPRGKEENYFLYIGATSDEKQLEETVKCYDKFREVIGIKLFGGKSVGELEVINTEKQRRVYKTLASLGYKGVVAVHCEKECYLKPELFKPENPVTHTFARPKIAEIESVRDQIEFAKETNFKGTLHICHVSCSESVELIDKARKKIKITCGVTPHHILWSDEMLNRSDGLLYKMNPPLRNLKEVEKLRKSLKDGKINWIETDHAPHCIGEKLFPPYLSGFPSLYLYKDFVENFLPNIGITRKQIEMLTYGNICKTFGDKIK
jgi:dihydroorotase